MNIILPKTNCVTHAWQAMSRVSEFDIQLEYVFPLERTFCRGQVRNFMLIISSPDQLYPWHIHFIIEFMEVFQQQGIILQIQIFYHQPSFILCHCHHFPGSYVIAFSIKITTSPKTIFSKLVNNFYDCFRQTEGAHEVYRERRDNWVNKLQPAWIRKVNWTSR